MRHRNVFRIMAEDAITAKEHVDCGEGSTEVIELTKYNELCRELEKCYSEIKDKEKIIAESYQVSSGTSSSKINWLIEKGMTPIGIVLGDDRGDRTIVDFGAVVKVNREDFRKLLTPNDYEMKFEKISK